MMMREKRKNNNNGNKGPILALVLISALFSTLFVGSNAVADDNYVETKVCEWCDYDDAVALAKQDYLLPDCEWQGNGGSGTSLLRLAIRAKRRLKTLLLQTLLPIALTNLK